MKIYNLPETGFVRLSGILRIFPVSKSTWWEMCADRQSAKACQVGTPDHCLARSGNTRLDREGEPCLNPSQSSAADTPRCGGAQDFCRRGRAYMQNGLLHFYPEARKAAADDLCNEYYDYRIVNRKATLPGGPRTPQFQCLRGRNLS
jgi:hypothetical protein